LPAKEFETTSSVANVQVSMSVEIPQLRKRGTSSSRDLENSGNEKPNEHPPAVSFRSESPLPNSVTETKDRSIYPSAYCASAKIRSRAVGQQSTRESRPNQIPSKRPGSVRLHAGATRILFHGRFCATNDLLPLMRARTSRKLSFSSLLHRYENIESPIRVNK
ncbi:hypothetical protein K0M31_019554, partial [Melipona bicolor]